MKLILTAILIFGAILSYSQDMDRLRSCFPNKVQYQHVYDLGGALSDSEEKALNDKLVAFTKETSNVINVVVPITLCGYDKSIYTIELGDTWGVGRADLDNGVVLMVLPKEVSESGRGETFIAIGTGLQGAITDLGTQRIIDYEMIQEFKQQNYAGGINNAVNALMELSSGEISEEDYMEKTNDRWKTPLLIVGIIILFFFMSRGNDDYEDYDKNGKRTTRRRPFIFFPMGGFGGGSGGSGGFGGGGFGGFGGGGFSGGGAGGSW